MGPLIRRHGLKCHFYADDTQIFGSCAAGDIEAFVSRLEVCLADVLLWMGISSLCLNAEKTEILIVGTAAQLRKVSFPSVRIGSAVIQPTPSSRVLGVSLDSQLSMQSQVSTICRSGWFHLRSLWKIRKCLSQQMCEVLVHAFISSRIDMCNGLLVGTNKSELNRLQRLLNAAARLVTLAPRCDPIQPILHQLHWLAVRERIRFKIALLTFKALHGLAPAYLSNLIKVAEPSRALRSSENGVLLQRPLVRLVMAEAAFAAAAPRVWNTLPLAVRSEATLSAFKSRLKTFLFTDSFM